VHSGYPWLSDEQQQSFDAAATAASSQAEQAAARPAVSQAAHAPNVSFATAAVAELGASSAESQSRPEHARVKGEHASSSVEVAQSWQQQQHSQAAAVSQEAKADKASPAASEAALAASRASPAPPAAGRGSERGVGPSHTAGMDIRESAMLGSLGQAEPVAPKQDMALIPDSLVGSSVNSK